MTWDQLPATYDAVAPEYETAFLDELDNKPVDQGLLGDFAARAADPVVDVGCGPGQVGRYVRRCGRAVLGVDLSEEMARRAGTRLDAALVADVRALPLASGSVGGVVAFYSLIHLRREELTGALVEVHRVLRASGRLLVAAHEGTGVHERAEFLGHPVPFIATLYSLGELVGAVTRAGLTVRDTRRREPYPTEGQTKRLYVVAEKVRPD